MDIFRNSCSIISWTRGKVQILSFADFRYSNEKLITLKFFGRRNSGIIYLPVRISHSYKSSPFSSNLPRFVFLLVRSVNERTKINYEVFEALHTVFLNPPPFAPKTLLQAHLLAFITKQVTSFLQVEFDEKFDFNFYLLSPPPLPAPSTKESLRKKLVRREIFQNAEKKVVGDEALLLVQIVQD